MNTEPSQVFVSGIPYSWTIDDLREEFKQYGHLTDQQKGSKTQLFHNQTALVEYTTNGDAQNAIFYGNGKNGLYVTKATKDDYLGPSYYWDTTQLNEQQRDEILYLINTGKRKADVHEDAPVEKRHKVNPQVAPRAITPPPIPQPVLVKPEQIIKKAYTRIPPPQLAKKRKQTNLAKIEQLATKEYVPTDLKKSTIDKQCPVCGNELHDSKQIQKKNIPVWEALMKPKSDLYGNKQACGDCYEKMQTFPCEVCGETKTTMLLLLPENVKSMKKIFKKDVKVGKICVNCKHKFRNRKANEKPTKKVFKKKSFNVHMKRGTDEKQVKISISLKKLTKRSTFKSALEDALESATDFYIVGQHKMNKITYGPNRVSMLNDQFFTETQLDDGADIYVEYRKLQSKNVK